MTVDVRTITADERPAFRRAVRAGFHHLDTEDDEAWAAAIVDDVDRAFVAVDAGAMVATLQSFATPLTLPGGEQVPAAALTAVTCRASHRRQGLLTQMISADLRSAADRGEPVGILIAAEYPIYGRFGYGPATFATRWELDTKAARFVTPGAGTVEFVDNETFRKEAPAIFERVRAARPGMIGRDTFNWDVAADLRRRPEDKPWLGFRLLCRDGGGVAQGWANYIFNETWDGMRSRCTIDVTDLCAATASAQARLWRFLAELDLVITLTAGDRPVDELLPWLLADARVARQIAHHDFVWVRPIDVPALLSSRSYPTAGRLVLEIVDDVGLATGRFSLEAAAEGASCRVSDDTADVTMPVGALGAISLGGVRPTTLLAAGGLDEHTSGAARRADALFATDVAPWCNTWF